MPSDRTDLARRLAAATPDDTSRGLNYTTLFAMVADHLGPAAPAEVDVLGQGRRTDFFSYPITEYLETTWNALDRLEPAFGGVDATLTELGRRTMAGFLASMVGRTALRVTGREPVRLLRSAASGYRGAVSYGERTVEFPGARQAVLSFRRDFMPATFHAAVLLTALQATSAIRPRVVGTQDGPLDSSYRIAWD